MCIFLTSHFWLSSFLCREPCESEDVTSLPSSYLSSSTENGRLITQARSRPNSKSTLEENAYEDIVGKHPSSLALFYLTYVYFVRPAGFLVGWNGTFQFDTWGTLTGPFLVLWYFMAKYHKCTNRSVQDKCCKVLLLACVFCLCLTAETQITPKINVQSLSLFCNATANLGESSSSQSVSQKAWVRVILLGITVQRRMKKSTSVSSPCIM